MKQKSIEQKKWRERSLSKKSSIKIIIVIKKLRVIRPNKKLVLKTKSYKYWASRTIRNVNTQISLKSLRDFWSSSIGA